MTSLLILGAGGHSKVVVETALSFIPNFDISLLDDCYSSQYQCPDLRLADTRHFFIAPDPTFSTRFSYANVAVANSFTCLFWIGNLQSFGYIFPSFIHSTVLVSFFAQTLPALFVFVQPVIQAIPFIVTVNIINTFSSIDYYSRLQYGVHICPNVALAGEVHIGLRSWIRIGSSVIQNIHIGSDFVVGAAAAVIHNIPDGVTVCGVPVRVISN